MDHGARERGAPDRALGARRNAVPKHAQRGWQARGAADGEQVLDSGPRVTASDDRVTFYCGSASRSVTPSPFRLFIDEVSIQAATLP